MKYIIIESHSHLFIPIIFPNNFNHAEIARKFSYFDIKSAGFVTRDCDGEIATHGESLSLHRHAMEDDAAIIMKRFDEFS